MRGYSFYDSIKMGINYFATKILFRKCRLIRFPIFIRYKNRINFGNNLTTGRFCRLEAFGHDDKKQITFGNDCQINDFVHIAAINDVSFGDNVLIASRVFISDHNHGDYSSNSQSVPEDLVALRPLFSKPVKIENNVWIGEGVSVLPGVRIGKNSIIGTNSVVTQNIPANSIAAGIPARVIKKYDGDKKKWVSTK